ncbi:MAG: hypothetical protein DMF61_07790 [Blastocatellia bacterium AA13]|nr:MAG: hypothetical protein DMF61_07790 [Blastocatellia bacterium AA13]
MSFEETLTGILGRVEGGIAAVILGIDGIPIERSILDKERDLDIDLITTEFTTLLRRSMRVASDTALGDLKELVLVTNLMTYLLRPITPEYFMLLAISPRGNVGRARFELRKAQLSLEEEFAI